MLDPEELDKLYGLIVRTAISRSQGATQFVTREEFSLVQYATAVDEPLVAAMVKEAGSIPLYGPTPLVLIGNDGYDNLGAHNMPVYS